MKNIYYLLILLGFSLNSHSQEVYLKTGKTFSKLYDNSPIDIYDNNIKSFYMSCGINYLSHKFGEIASEIGILKTGGFIKFNEEHLGQFYYVDMFTYINYNTIYKLKYEKNNIKYYAGIGPSLDMRIFPEDFNFKEMKDNSNFKNFAIGIKYEAGIGFYYGNMYIGTSFLYMTNLTENVKLGDIDMHNKSLGFSLNIGYKLKAK